MSRTVSLSTEHCLTWHASVNHQLSNLVIATLILARTWSAQRLVRCMQESARLTTTRLYCRSHTCPTQPVQEARYRAAPSGILLAAHASPGSS